MTFKATDGLPYKIYTVDAEGFNRRNCAILIVVPYTAFVGLLNAPFSFLQPIFSVAAAYSSNMLELL